MRRYVEVETWRERKRKRERERDRERQRETERDRERQRYKEGKVNKSVMASLAVVLNKMKLTMRVYSYGCFTRWY